MFASEKVGIRTAGGIPTELNNRPRLEEASNERGEIIFATAALT